MDDLRVNTGQGGELVLACILLELGLELFQLLDGVVF